MDNKDYKKLRNKIDDAYDYFNGYRLEETNSDDTYYIKALMEYIEYLEGVATRAQNRAIEEISKNTNLNEIF